MTDQNRQQRPSIDLDELERQLREAAGSRAAPSAPATPSAAKDDPLAELARIVGQDDPYRASWPEGGRQPAQAQGYAPQAQAYAQPQYQAAGQDTRFDDELNRLAAPAGTNDPGHAPPYAASARAEGYGDEAYAAEDIDYSGPSGGRRKRVLAIVAVLAVAGIGVGIGVMTRNGSVMKFTGAPPVIQAETGPSKVQPENPGGTVVPNQDRQIYSKQTNEDTKGAKVVTGEEQPVDVVQAARREAPRVVSAPTPTPATATSTSGTAVPAKTEAGVLPGLGEPRKVKTVSVRPDGSVIDAASADTAPPQRVIALTQAAPEAPRSSVPSMAVATPAPAPTPAAAPVPTPRPQASSATPAPTTTAAVPAKPAPAPAAAPATPAAAPAKPAPATTAAVTPRATTPTQVASAQPIVPQEQDAAAGSGGWAVQLAGTPSEQEAQDAASRFAKRFANELGGATPSVRKADVNGKTLYRVRVQGLSREDAAALCARLQAAGGQCFVAKG